MAVRCKFKCFSVQPMQTGTPGEPMAQIVMMPDYGDQSGDNKSWSKATPSGNIQLYVTNPAAIEEFVPGKNYYIDFRDADARSDDGDPPDEAEIAA